MNGSRELTHNKLKIVSNRNLKSLSFYLMNEKGRWMLVSNYSDLSRKKYKAANIFEAGEDIIAIIDRDYNTGGRGVDIRFEGSDEEYHFLQECVKKHFHGQDVTCSHHRAAIAVAGKKYSGKSTFIEEMCKYMGEHLSSVQLDGYEKYTSQPSNTVWYEIAGIDFGKIIAAKDAFTRIVPEGITDFIYCLSTTKIEEPEEALILYIKENYPYINILLLLTQCLDEGSDLFVEHLSKQVNGVKVLPVLAVPKKTRSGTIESYGIDDVSRYLFEGKMR